MTLEEYINAVEETLQYWLDIHTKADKWAEGWIMDEDVQYTFKECPTISNNYFTFEWRKSALKQLAEDSQHLYNICENCGCLNENGFDDCCEDVKPGDEPSIEELTEWLIEIEAQPTDNALLKSLENDGFKVYEEALKNTIAPIVEEVNAVIKAIAEAESPEDRLQAVLWGTRVFHVHGNILSDYGERANYNLEYKMVDNIRNNGLNSVFTEEEITEYLEEK